MIFRHWPLWALVGCAALGSSAFAQYSNPSASEDAAIERTRLLRAVDQIDVVTRQVSEMQQDMQASRRETDLLREDVTSLRSENNRLKKDLAASEERRIQERDAVLKEVAKIVAQKRKTSPKSEAQEETKVEKSEEKSDPSPTVDKADSQSSTKTMGKKERDVDEPSSDPEPEPAFDIKPGDDKKPAAKKDAAKKEEGYEHVVEKGQTLWIIAQAYQKKGVHVTVADICKANDMKSGDKLHVGQKLFIPKKD